MSFYELTMGVRLLHACQAGVANQVVLQFGVEGALTAQPGESTLCLFTQMNLRKLCLARFCRGGIPDLDLDQIGAGYATRTGHLASVHALSSDQVGLGLRVGGEDVEDGDNVLIGKTVGFTIDEAADETAREAALAADVALVEVVLFGLALEGNAEIAHGGVDGGWLIVGGVKATWRDAAGVFFYLVCCTIRTGTWIATLKWRLALRQ